MEHEVLLDKIYDEITVKLIYFNTKLIKLLQQEKYEKAAELRDLIIIYLIDESKVIQKQIGGRVKSYSSTLKGLNNVIINELILKYL